MDFNESLSPENVCTFRFLSASFGISVPQSCIKHLAQEMFFSIFISAWLGVLPNGMKTGHRTVLRGYYAAMYPAGRKCSVKKKKSSGMNLFYTFIVM